MKMLEQMRLYFFESKYPFFCIFSSGDERMDPSRIVYIYCHVFYKKKKTRSRQKSI